VTRFLVLSGPSIVRDRFFRWLVVVAWQAVVLLALAAPAARARAADDATAQARSHYEVGLKLFDAREHEQALIEFQAANELKSRPAALFMMAQCEYLLGRLKDARAHYERYATENPTGEFVELAKDRIQSIDKRPSTFVINTVPDGVTVRIRAEGTPAVATDLSGQAPNNFQIPRGHYRIDVTKKNFQGQTLTVDVDIAETKPLFFKLEPIPARLEIETVPPQATLYVNGNRARNPYRQDVGPGHYEVFAEAPDHEGRAVEFVLSPGQQKRLLGRDALHLAYEQRSGRPELVVTSAVMGGLVGAGAVAAAIGKDLQKPEVASVLLISGGLAAGVITGALVATTLVPRYVADNRALFILGGMWVGAAEGVATGVIWQQVQSRSQGCQAPNSTETVAGFISLPCRPPLGLELRAGFVGSLPGLALGLTAGSLLADRAPTYGRVAIIQSAALGGAFAGALVQMTAQWKPYGATWDTTVGNFPPDAMSGEAPKDHGECIDLGGMAPPTARWKCTSKDASVLDLMPGALIGLNLGLATGLVAAYASDQSKYGPSWKRVLLVDLATGAGMLVGGISGCVANTDGCLNGIPQDNARSIAAVAGLAGGTLGLLGGLLLTRHTDDDQQGAGSAVASSLTLIPTPAPPGGALPGVTAMGTF
jgi:hypothetical protein